VAGQILARFHRLQAEPGALKLAIWVLAAALALLAAGLQLSYRPPPLRFSVPIHDGEILIAPEVRLGLPAAPRDPPATPRRPGDLVAAVDTPGERRPPLPAPPELAAVLAREPDARVAVRPERAGDRDTTAAMPALPVPEVVVGTLTPPPAAGRPSPAPPTAPEAPAPSPAVAVAPPPLPVLAAPPAPPGGPAWMRHAQPFVDEPGRPLIAIVLWGLGRNAELAEAAIAELPGMVTLGMTPASRRPQHWADRARAAGHELLVEVPMEPLGYPDLDPGPQALLTDLPEAENLRRLERWLDAFEGHIGATNLMGSRFTASPAHMRPVLRRLKARGLVFFDSRATGNSVAHTLAGEIGLDRAVNNRYIDNEPTATAIDLQLAELELTARANGQAIAIGTASAVTIARLKAWIATLAAKGLRLAPLSAVLQRGSAG